jgi:hypothetical protein
MILADTTTPENLGELLEAMPAVWTLLLAATAAVGLLLWTLGGRLAKTGVMLSGFVLGGLCAMVLAAALSRTDADGQSLETSRLWILAIGIGGAIAGVLLAALLFRVWMGISGALLLAAVVPAAAMIWAGNGPPLTLVEQTQRATLDALGSGESLPAAEAMRQRLAGAAGGDGTPPTALNNSATEDDADTDPSTDLAEALFDREAFTDGLSGVWTQQVDEVRRWWEQMSAGQRRFLLAGAAVGGIVGLVLGLLLPTLAAALQSALVGSVLLFFAGRSLLLLYVPAAASAMPTSWRGVLLSLGLITLLGLLVQWTLRKRKADD